MLRRMAVGLGAMAMTVALAAPASAAPVTYHGDLFPVSQASTEGHVTITHIRDREFFVEVEVSGLRPGVYVFHWTNDPSTLKPIKGCQFRVRVAGESTGCSHLRKAPRSNTPLFAAVARKGDFYNPAGVASMSSDPIFTIQS